MTVWQTSVQGWQGPGSESDAAGGRLERAVPKGRGTSESRGVPFDTKMDDGTNPGGVLPVVRMFDVRRAHSSPLCARRSLVGMLLWHLFVATLEER